MIRIIELLLKWKQKEPVLPLWPHLVCTEPLQSEHPSGPELFWLYPENEGSPETNTVKTRMKLFRSLKRLCTIAALRSNSQISVESVQSETGSQYQSCDCINVNHMRLKAFVKWKKKQLFRVLLVICLVRLSPTGTFLSFAFDRKYLIVMNIFQSVADHANAHVNQIRGGHLEDLLGELHTVLVDLLYTIRGTFPVGTHPIYFIRRLPH